MYKDYRVDYHLTINNGVVTIEKDYFAEVVATSIEGAKEEFKLYIKDNTDYGLPQVKITNITELQKGEQNETYKI